MNPVFTVTFKATTADKEITEETVTLHDGAEFFDFVAPGGPCDGIPDSVDEITIMFLKSAHPNQTNPLADRTAVLELGMVIFTGPLSMIVHTMDELLDRAGRGEVSESFLAAVGVAPSTRIRA